MIDFLAFMFVGFLAQLVDGALGMGVGVISSSILLAQGIPPALASASVNAAKLPTTSTAALSHTYHRYINWSIARKLCRLFSDERAELREDPVTGSLNGSLAQWFFATGRAKSPLRYQSGGPSWPDRPTAREYGCRCDCLGSWLDDDLHKR